MTEANRNDAQQDLRQWEHDADLWPEAADELDPQCQDGPTVSGAINVARV
ncbi:hypothetical protein [Vreelandella sp. H-I2]